MRTSYAMMDSNVTPPAEDEGAEKDGVIEAGRAAVCVWGCLSLNCAVLRQMIATSTAHIYVK